MKKTSSLLVVLMLMLASFAAGLEYPRGDVDQDGTVSISDVTTLIDYLLTGTWPDEHEWVDLGLPSGTLWATCNIGASSPEDYGDYFAWGETEPKEVYDWRSYSLCGGSQVSMKKYCTKASFGYGGYVDNKTELDPEDDAAYVNWGPSWRIPSVAQSQELFNCLSGWSQRNGVNGLLFTGSNGATLFLPAAGCRIENTINHGFGCYWLCSLDIDTPSKADYLDFTSRSIDWNTAGRYNGYPVRAVRVSSNLH